MIKIHGFTQDFEKINKSLADPCDYMKELNDYTFFELQERDCYFKHPEKFFPSSMCRIKKSKRSPYIKFVAYGHEYRYHAKTIRTTPGMFSFNFNELDRLCKNHIQERIKFHQKEINSLRQWLKG